MAGRFRLTRTTAVTFGLAGGLLNAPGIFAFDLAPEYAYPAFPTITSARSRTVAEAAERAELWETALEHYLGLYLSAGPCAELRDKIRHCLRHASQIRRHRDPAFQQFVLNLPAADALNLYADALGKLSSLYADKDRATTPRLFALGLEELDRALGDPTFRSAQADPVKVRAFRESLRTGWENRLPPGAKEARQMARDLAAAAHDQAGVTNPSAVVLELLSGACAGLDEYTTYLPPPGEDADPMMAPAAEFAAYGVVVRLDAGGWLIDEVAANSWAALNTPLRKGQRLFLLDADRTASPFGFVAEAADADGSSPPLLLRFPVPAPTAFAADLGTMKDGIGYVRISAFRDDTPRELDERVLLLRSEGMRGLILDLRGNPGGLFPAAVDVAQRFLPGGVVATAQGQSPEFAGRVFSSAAGLAAWTFPVVVLVDTRTMSAAEVVAGALKGGQARLIGTPTFGKGVVQSSVRLNRTDAADATGGTLVLTVATLCDPAGSTLNGGVVPHVVEIDPARQLDLAVLRLSVLIHTSH